MIRSFLQKNGTLLKFFCSFVVLILFVSYQSSDGSYSKHNLIINNELSDYCKEEKEDKAIDWRDINVTNISPEEIISYLYWTNRSSCALIHDFGGRIWRIPTGIDGQKAVCLDQGKAPAPENCIVYSFGINNEWSFDELMENYGCKVFAFDPSMGKEDHKHSEKIFFFNTGLSDREGTKNGWKLNSLSSIYETIRKNHHQGNDIIDYLKIDIEFDEWIALPDIVSSGMIKKVRQLGVEFHLPRDEMIDHYRKLIGIIKSIEDSGMIRFDSKYNPFFMDRVPALNYVGSRGFEIAWYRQI